MRLLERSEVDKALIISLVCLCARLVNAVVLQQASRRPSFLATVHTDVLAFLIPSLWGMAAFWAVMVTWGLAIRRRKAVAPVHVTLVVQGVVLSDVWVAFISGHYASQSVIIVAGFLALCYLGFPRRYYFPATLVAVVLFVAGTIVERLGWIPYAPLLVTAPGGLGAHPDGTLALLGLIMIGWGVFVLGGILVFNVRRLRASEERLRQESRTDPLTGLPNRRHFMETARHEIAHATRRQLPISVLVIDVDRFKGINDQYGHAAGDRVLSVLARTLAAAIREEDTLARIGGDEFVVVLPGTDIRDAEFVAERCLRTVEKADFTFEGVRCVVTASIGVAEYTGDLVLSPDEIIAPADKALYRAKKAGRNCYRTGKIVGTMEERIDATGERTLSRSVRTRFSA